MRVEFHDRAVYLPGPDALVVADLHVGRDATANVTLPLGEREDLLDRLGTLLDRTAPAEVVVAGDLLHAFGEVPTGVRETVAAIEDRVADAGAGLTVTPGNHDAMLDVVTDVDRTPVRRAGEAVICHGHEVPDRDAGSGAGPGGVTYVFGHEHPAIVIEGRRRPCFLRGPGLGGDLLALPSFNRLVAGTPVNDLRGGDALSPLADDLDALRPVVVVDGDPLEFPPLDRLRSRL